MSSQNVVNVVPRKLIFARRITKERQRAALDQLTEQRRGLRQHMGHVEFHFPRSVGRRSAKESIIADLISIDDGSERFFRIYPTEYVIRESEARNRR